MLRATLALALLSSLAAAQTTTTVGPDAVPLGGRLSITLSNDNPGKFGITTGLWEVFDAGGASVYAATSGPAILMGPGGWYTERWELVDQGGQPVPPGSYRVDVRYDTFAPVESIPFTVTADGAAVTLEGTASIQPVFGGGPSHPFSLMSPADPGAAYWLLASDSAATGFPICGGTFPLDPTPLFTFSLAPTPLLPNAFGLLDAKGRSLAPRLELPNDASLGGLALAFAFAVLDTSAPCPVVRSSGVHQTVVVP